MQHVDIRMAAKFTVRWRSELAEASHGIGSGGLALEWL
jgi:hypothetical protein